MASVARDIDHAYKKARENARLTGSPFDKYLEGTTWQLTPNRVCL